MSRKLKYPVIEGESKEDRNRRLSKEWQHRDYAENPNKYAEITKNRAKKRESEREVPARESNNPNGIKGGLKYELLPGETREAYDRRINAQYARKWREVHPDYYKDLERKKTKDDPGGRKAKQRIQNLQKSYGISIEQYDAILASQNGVCLICGKEEAIPPNRKTKTPKNLSVDHCHDTGRVRGLLCHRCNTGIGYLGHSPERLQRAIEYLEFSFDPEKDFVCI